MTLCRSGASMLAFALSAPARAQTQAPVAAAVWPHVTVQDTTQFEPTVWTFQVGSGSALRTLTEPELDLELLDIGQWRSVWGSPPGNPRRQMWMPPTMVECDFHPHLSIRIEPDQAFRSLRSEERRVG